VETTADLRLSLRIVPTFGHELTVVLPERYPARPAYVLECSQRASLREVAGAGGMMLQQMAAGQVAPDAPQTWQRLLSPRHITAIAQLLDTGAVPVLPSAGMLGLDGTTFTLEIAVGSNSTRFSWWVELPTEWEVIGEIAELLITVADPPYRDEYRFHRRIN
jgi:hypothetical protein